MATATSHLTDDETSVTDPNPTLENPALSNTSQDRSNVGFEVDETGEVQQLSGSDSPNVDKKKQNIFGRIGSSIRRKT